MSHRGPRHQRQQSATGEVEVDITALGAAGDGIAKYAGRRLFVPMTLPGERWRVRTIATSRDGVRAEPLARLHGPERASPVCRHFGVCGACALQHVPAATCQAFKIGSIEEALARAGVRCERMPPLAISPLHSRRRLRLAWSRHGDTVRLGFRARRGREVIAISECPIAAPPFVELLAPLATLLCRLDAARGSEGEASLTLADNGVDLLLSGLERLGPADLERLSAFAHAQDLCRIATAAQGDGVAEPVLIRRAPAVRFGPVTIELPAGAFLQATREGELALQGAVAAWTAGSSRIVDLFAGLGTLSLPLVGPGRRLTLVEGDAAAVAALRRGIRHHSGAMVEIEQRDLEHRPLLPLELAPFDTAVLDPPRAGARAQIAALALSTVSRIVYVSCHPGSFARDARVLVDAGFTLAQLRPVDQFLYSPRIELAALLTR